jgi:CRP-like cAMP-binding protein
MTTDPAIDKRALLAQHFLLAQLPADDLDRLLESAAERSFGANQTIFQKGDPGTSLMAVIAGRVRISVFSEDGKEIILNIVEPGQIFGEIALLDGKPRTADAAAMTPTRLLVLERRGFVPALEANPRIALRLIELLCARVRQTSELVESVALLEYGARLAKLLLRLADGYGEQQDGRIRINLKISQADLGNLIASTRESVNRQLNAWVEEGVIALERGRITILDRALLAACIEAPD